MHSCEKLGRLPSHPATTALQVLDTQQTFLKVSWGAGGINMKMHLINKLSDDSLRSRE